MNTTAKKFAAIGLCLLAFALPARADNGCPLSPYTLIRPLVRAWPGYPGRDIRAIPVLPFATVIPCPPRSSAPQMARLEFFRPGAVAVMPAAEPTVTVTITLPASLARELVASGAIKLPEKK